MENNSVNNIPEKNGNSKCKVLEARLTLTTIKGQK